MPVPIMQSPKAAPMRETSQEQLSNLDPAIGPPGGADAQTITVANIADDAFEAGVPRWKRAFARVGVRRSRP